MKHKLIIVASATIFPFIAAMYCAGRTVKAEANSAPPYWEGTDASGAVVKGEDCPVVVEKETLSLNISSLPRGGRVELDSYAAEAIAEYSFYNPTDLDVDMTLLFPFGAFPSYVPEGANDEVSAVSVDGESAECSVRYSYAPYEFDIDRDMARILEEKKADAFYREDMPVKEYRLSMDTSEAVEACSLKIKLCYNAKKTRVLFPSDSCTRLSIWGGDMYAYTSFGKDDEKSAVFYTVGEPLTEAVPKLYGGREELAALSVTTNRDMTFSEFVLQGLDEDSGVGETDWYNAFVDMLNDRSMNGGSVDCFSLSVKNLMRWYEYSMNIPAKGRALNRVKAPLYPTVEGNKNPRYEYSYLLSPAGKWADFRNIEIRIDTPYYLSNGSLDFTRADNEDGKGFTYTFARNSLPQGELTFVLTERNASDSDFNMFGGKKFLLPSLTWAFVTLTVLAVIAAVVTVIVVVSLKKKRKKK